MELPILTSCLLFVLLPKTYNAESFSAIAQLEKLLQADSMLVEALNNYVETTTEDVASHLIRFMYTARAKNEAALKDKHYAESPINAFHLVKRFAKGWESVVSEIACEGCDITQAVQDFSGSVSLVKQVFGPWPSDYDLAGIRAAVLDLSFFYQLNMQNLFNGQILDFKSDPLPLEDIFLIARSVNESKMQYKEINWLSSLLEKIINENIQHPEITEAKVYRALASAYQKVDMTWKSVQLLQECITADPSNEAVRRDINYYESILKNIPEEQWKKHVTIPTRDDLQMYEEYRQLCMGDIPSLYRQHQLKCVHRISAVPYYRIKEEILSYDPPISSFHDVISESEMQVLKHLGNSKMERSKVHHTHLIIRDRVSQTAWISDEDDELVRKLSKRVELITGLSTIYRDVCTDAEKFQVVNYGVGGMYIPHFDVVNTPLSKGPSPKTAANLPFHGSGDRLATWMFYLNDVRAGGATVFPILGVRVQPVKGAAAFWYNVNRRGELDERTLHAGCPVLLGSKWISNKWIREGGSMFRRKCGQTEDVTS